MRENVDLKPYTYFKIGGPARYFEEVATEDALREAVKFAESKGLPIFVMGAASNMLVADSGFPGLVIKIMMRDIERQGNSLIIGAGVPNAIAVARATTEELAGFEWAVGIPGSIGGSVRGNAGCFSGEMQDVVASVTYFDINTGEVKEGDNAFCEFGYRESIFKKHPEFIIMRAVLSLRPGTSETIQKLVRFYTAGRSKSQDIGSSSAGCIFKNVAWPADEEAKKRLIYLLPQLTEYSRFPTFPAGLLIDRGCNLKGKQVGKAVVSSSHANFIINTGGATAEEIIMLIGLIKEYVHRKYNVHLEEEIQYVGF